MNVRLIVLLAASVAAFAQAPASELRERRAKLRAELGAGIVIMAGYTERDHDGARGPFFQEPNFFYLTGWREPGAMLVITPKEEVLLVPRRNEEREKWTGRKMGPADAAIGEKTGFANVVALEEFESRLPSYLSAGTRVYTLVAHPLNTKLQSLLALRDIADVAPAIARLRMYKSESEMAALQRSIDASVAAHRAAWARMAAGLYEYQIASTMMNVWQDAGCVRNAYAPIIGSGPNANVLHYSANSRRMDSGDLMLVDAAAECGGYAADITRTVPVDRKFTARQREVYMVVLGAVRAVTEAARPGKTIGKTTPNSLYTVAIDYLNAHGKDSKGAGLGKYMTHGVSHHVGLDVHDAADNAAPLAPGMVITIEPGVYIPEENIGIRIEEMVLITENGARVLTAALPVDPSEIEKELAKSSRNATAR